MTFNKQNGDTTRKIWLPEEALESLVSALGEELSENPTDTTVRALHDEAAVARQRFSSTTNHPEAVTKALGQTIGAIPLSLTLNEGSYLCSLVRIPTEVRQFVMKGLL